MCLVAYHLAVKSLPLSRELFVIGCPKTQTTSLRIIIVQRILCFKVPLAHSTNILGADNPGQIVISDLSFPRILEIPTFGITSLSLGTPIKLSLVSILSNQVCTSSIRSLKPRP
jgi:hypothetical protein